MSESRGMTVGEFVRRQQSGIPDERRKEVEAQVDSELAMRRWPSDLDGVTFDPGPEHDLVAGTLADLGEGASLFEIEERLGAIREWLFDQKNGAHPDRPAYMAAQIELTQAKLDLQADAEREGMIEQRLVNEDPLAGHRMFAGRSSPAQNYQNAVTHRDNASTEAARLYFLESHVYKAHLEEHKLREAPDLVERFMAGKSVFDLSSEEAP